MWLPEYYIYVVHIMFLLDYTGLECSVKLFGIYKTKNKLSSSILFGASAFLYEVFRYLKDPANVLAT